MNPLSRRILLLFVDWMSACEATLAKLHIEDTVHYCRGM